jgi:predicted metalloprotease with PDZ domain
MRHRLDAAGAAFLLLAATGTSVSAAGTRLSYLVDLSDPTGSPARISLQVTGYPYEESRIVLAEPPASPEKYFAFFDGLEFEGEGGTPLAPTRSGDGIHVVHGTMNAFEVRYRVHLDQLREALGDHLALPFVAEDRLVLPLRAILAMPEEVDTKALAVREIEIEFLLPEAWSLLSPWPTFHGLATLRQDAVEELRQAVIASGDFAVEDGLDLEMPYVHVFHGGTPEATTSLRNRLIALQRHLAAVFGTGGEKPLSVTVEFQDGDADVYGTGRYFRVRCPEAFALAAPAEIRSGSAAHGFYLRLAHELFHRWLGSAGIIRPLGAEVLWFSEGAAEYVGILALGATGIAEPETVLQSLASRIERYRDLPARGQAVNADLATYEADAAYREHVEVKGPLLCLMLDGQLQRVQGSSLWFPDLLRRIFYSTFIRRPSGTAAFSEADLGEGVAELLGAYGEGYLQGLIASDVYARLRPELAAVGFTWSEGEGGALSLGLAGSAPYRRSLGPIGPSRPPSE